MKTLRAGKLLPRLALSLCLLCLSPRPAAAWGSKAHRIIALVAESLLNPEAKRQVGVLLNGGTLVSVAVWADSNGNRAWHFVDIPLNSYYNAERDCPNGDCLVGAIESQRRILADGSGGQQRWKERGEALKYLVHLVGDAHQPLHCADNNGDRGGNAVKVTFYGRATTLHRVWDSDIVDKVGYGESVYAGRLKAQALKWRAAGAEGGNALTWVATSHELARYAYNLPASGNLGNDYYNYARPVVDERLAKAAVRLAKILNDSLR